MDSRSTRAGSRKWLQGKVAHYKTQLTPKLKSHRMMNSFLLTSTGCIFSWGQNRGGACGHDVSPPAARDELPAIQQPTRIEDVPPARLISVCSVRGGAITVGTIKKS